jgi:KipI family sensor histidine kinase inhibitor
MTASISQISETCIIAYFGNEIDTSLVSKLALFTHHVKHRFQDQIIEIIPSYTSVLIEFHPLRIEINELLAWCHQQIALLENTELSRGGKLVRLPVYYHPDVAPDLNMLAADKGLSVDEVIRIHSEVEYTVCAIGFAPGFAFLGSVDKRIATPRHREPRFKVAKGSVGIADLQTAVYPLETPGGWQIIGNCPVSLFDPHSEPMMPFDVGDRVCFAAIDREQYFELGGVIEWD